MKANLLAVLLVLVSSILAHTVNAAPYAPYRSYNQAPQTAISAPEKIVRTGINKLTTFIRNGGAQNPEQARIFLESDVAPYFDFNYMARWAAGPAWRTMNPEQRARLQDKITLAFMTTLTEKLTSYTNQPIRYFTPRGQGSDDIRVSAWIMQPNGIPTKLEFRFYKGKDGWKIFDVKAGGNSAVVYYRQQFRNLYRPGMQTRY
ncbi:MAG: ABC transporter substrate-binding protein [Gammaproteobacteria bacterium]|jgi:phospholipid transport system substrate-binding protein